MRLLLDTHAFLWWVADDTRVSARAREAIAVRTNEIFVSAATVWELSIKSSLGKLALKPPLVGDFIATHLAPSGFSEMPIRHAHAVVVQGLPRRHGDPFDSMLVAQAQVERATLVTADPLIRGYDVATLW